MLGIGRWKTRNKILPGVYINFPSNRGIVDSQSSGDNPNVDQTTKSILGVGVLGKMILGKRD